MISTNLINDICGVIPIDLISELFEVARFKQPEIIIKKADEFLCYGYDIKQFNYQFTDFIASNNTLTDEEKGKINSFILDCEIVAFDSKTNKIQPFQLLTTRARKNVNIDDISIKVCLFMFDLIYLNGESIIKNTLDERRKILKDNFNLKI